MRFLTHISFARSRQIAKELARLLVVVTLQTSPVSAAEAPVVPAGDVLISTWEMSDGLPSNSATAMVQTGDGYLWIGTFNGLVRFNGTRFDVFTPDDTPSLPSVQIVNLHLDRSNRLWVSTVGGLVVREGQAWRRVGLDPDADREEPVVARSFAEGPTGNLLIATFDGRLLAPSGDGLQLLPRPTDERTVLVAAADVAGNWWVAQDGCISRWDGSAWRTVDRPSRGVAIGCARARNGGVWIVVGQEVRRYWNGALESSMRIENTIRRIWSMTEDSGGRLWVCTLDDGVLRIGTDGRVERWDSKCGLAADSFRFAFEDRERNIWLGANDGGLSRLRPRRVFSYGTESGLRDRNVTSVLPEADGSVLVASYGGGLSRLVAGAATPIPLPWESGESLYVQSVLRTRSGAIWAGTFGEGVYIVDESSTRRIPTELTGGGNIIAMFEDSVGRVWVSGGSGVAAFSPEGRVVFGASEAERFHNVSAFAEDAQGGVLVSDLRGVFRIAGGVVSELREPAGAALSGVLCIRAEADGTVWMGTDNGRLLRWRAGELKRVDVGSSHGVGSIFAILPDRHGDWWMPSDRGVLRLARSRIDAAADDGSGQIDPLIFSTEAGLPSTNCTGRRQPLCGQDSAGSLWFATPRGVAVIDPESIVLNAVPPPVHIEEVSFGAREARDTNRSGTLRAERVRVQPPYGEPVSIPPGSRRIRIDYAAASFSEPQSVQYEVMLEGIDRSWQDVGNERSVEYMSLSPGRHVFRVRAVNEDGVWNEAGDTVAVLVRPLFWQILWVRIAGVVLFAGVVAGVSLWSTNLRHEARRRSEIEFRTLVETAPSAIVLVDADGMIGLVNANTERTFMWRREELLGRSIDVLLPSRTREMDAFLRGEGGDGEAEWMHGAAVEISGRRKDGSEIRLEVALSSLRTHRGRGTLASFTNIEERKRREHELSRQRNELAHLSRVSLLGEMSGALAHELNQPLASILSNAQAGQQMMKTEPIDLAEIRDILSDIVAQAKRAGDVIRHLRTLLRPGDTLDEEVDLSDLVRQVMPLLHSDLVEHGVVASLQLADVLPVRGDAVQYQQVLINLILNGTDAVADEPPSRRRLLIRTGSGEDHTWVAVSVSGPGIPGELLETVFEPFFTTKKRGMGLGLAVCRTIVEANKGQITAENYVGGGATFRFSIPAFKGPTADA